MQPASSIPARAAIACGYQVTCSTTGGSQITCPNESSPTISVKTSYDTLQQIINPGFLTTPIGTNEWMNIFTAFYLQRIDPTTKGRTSGFSEFVAVDLGATNSQGAGTLQLLPPLQQNDARVFPVGTLIPVEFQLKSIAQPSQSITDATAGITVVMTRDANGNPTSTLLFGNSSAFTYTGRKLRLLAEYEWLCARNIQYYGVRKCVRGPAGAIYAARPDIGCASNYDASVFDAKHRHK